MRNSIRSPKFVQRHATLHAVVLAVLFVIAGCRNNAESKSGSVNKPAEVHKLPVETELATIRLSEQAAERLGIKSTRVEKRHISQRRTFGGEALVQPGNTLVVTAPVPGIVSQHPNAEIPRPGDSVRRQQFIVDLIPLLSPERDVMTPAERVQLVAARAGVVTAQQTALGDLERSQAEVDAATISYARAEKLLESGAGSRKTVDDAAAQLNIAHSNLQAARQRSEQLAQMLEQLKPEGGNSDARPLELSSPIAGVVRAVNVRIGQTVAVGAPLFEVINLESVWIRVPVFVDLLDSIDKQCMARLAPLSGLPPRTGSTTPVEAAPVMAPPSADPMSSSADLYYEIDNRTLGLRPGQRVGVELPLTGKTESFVVASNAIMYDVFGGTWIYEVTGEREFTRRRVVVNWTAGDFAVLAAGPDEGTEIVTSGAAELFGTEFGAGK